MFCVCNGIHASNWLKIVKQMLSLKDYFKSHTITIGYCKITMDNGMNKNVKNVSEPGVSEPGNETAQHLSVYNWHNMPEHKASVSIHLLLFKNWIRAVVLIIFIWIYAFHYDCFVRCYCCAHLPFQNVQRKHVTPIHAGYFSKHSK